MKGGYSVDFKAPGLNRFERVLQRHAESATAAMGQSAIALVQHRTLEGVGLNDQPMPPLSKSYAKKEGKTVRNLRRSGTMMRDIHVESVTQRNGRWRARISFATGWGRELARQNQARAAWFGLSPSDKTKLHESTLALAKKLAASMGRR